MDEDFSWSEPPARPRRRITADARRVSRVNSRSSSRADGRRSGGEDPSDHHRAALIDPEPVAGPRSALDQATQVHSHFDEMMAEWNQERARTVVITGRGDDRYMPPSRRRSRSSDLRFHERAGFTPDRTAMWAVLLGLVLLIACIAH